MRREFGKPAMVILVALLFAACGSTDRDGTDTAMDIVKIDGGLVSGVPDSTPDIHIFKGIPYAAPPVGNLRWRPPQPVVPWEGVKHADRFGNISWQTAWGEDTFYGKEFPRGEQTMSEDCLFLNVWTPARSSEEKLPVMMWIHGGAFLGGFGHEIEFDGEGFCRKGIVLVTINYRTGVFGFMAHPTLSQEFEEGVSGNYGILDQIAALNWIKNNIRAFGGDPDNVTVFGQSAGAMSVQTLAVSPLCSGLFHKAIMMSGGGIKSLGVTLPLTDAEKIGIEIGAALEAESIEELRKIPADELLSKATGFAFGGDSGERDLRFVPNVDNYVLKEDTTEAVLNNNHHEIPYLLGMCANDMKEPAEISVDVFNEMAAIRYGKHAGRYLEICDVTTDEQASRIEGDATNRRMLAALRAWAEIQEEQGRNPSYLYYFDRKLPGDDAGAFHSADLWYVFETLSRCWRPFENLDHGLSEKMSSYWANFAKTGSPNGEGLPGWKPYTKKVPFVMELGENVGTMAIEEEPLDLFLKDHVLGKLE